MELNMIRANIEERDEQTMARFLNGLNHPIKRITEFQKYNNMVELVHIAAKAERQVQEDIKYNKQRRTSHTSKPQPLLQQHQVEAHQVPPSFPSSQHFLKENRPQVANTQGMINHSMVSATSVEAKDTTRLHVGTRKFCSSMTMATKNT